MTNLQKSALVPDAIHIFSLDEIKEKTGISLNRNWNIALGPFRKTWVKMHKDNCYLMITEFDEFNKYNGNKCNCNYAIKEILQARIQAYEENNKDTKYFVCHISEELSEFENEEWKFSYLDMPKLLHEDILNGLCTIAEIIKVYELTGSDNYDFIELKQLDGAVVKAESLQAQIYA